MKELENFLIEAKKQTYANEEAPKEPSSRVQSVDYEYQSGNMVYHDTYFGGVQFMGCEVVYKDEKVLWGMNYHGITLDETLGEEAMDKALRPALMQVGNDDILPVRGPKYFENEEYVYAFDVNGSLENFNGIETITKENKKIYELRCSGGLIK